MFGKVLALVAGNKKAFGWIAGALAFGVTAYQLHDHVYSSGYNAAEAAMLAQYNKAIAEQQAEYDKAVNAALDTAKRDYESELQRVRGEQQVIERTKVVTEYVDRVIEVPSECDNLANNVVRLLSEATGIISSASNGSSTSSDPSGSANLLPTAKPDQR